MGKNKISKASGRSKLSTSSKRMKTLKNSYGICLIIMFSLALCLYSCEKKEPAAQPNPSEIMKKIAEQFPEYDKDLDYDSGQKSKELSESKAVEIYSSDKNKPVDLSKIEKYSIIQAGEKSADEIGIFKLYDKVNTEYVKEMSQTRITKMQAHNNSKSDIALSEISNNAEVRSYGNYVYYVSHPQKDKIFDIIEDTLRGVQ